MPVESLTRSLTLSLSLSLLLRLFYSYFFCFSVVRYSTASVMDVPLTPLSTSVFSFKLTLFKFPSRFFIPRGSQTSDSTSVEIVKHDSHQLNINFRKTPPLLSFKSIYVCVVASHRTTSVYIFISKESASGVRSIS